MKNVTIAIDDDVHRRARIHAAQMGTSLSALVKAYLQSIGGAGSYPLPYAEAVSAKAREMPMPFHAQTATGTAGAPNIAPAAATFAGHGPEGQPYFVKGTWVFTKDGKPRKPGAMRHLSASTEDLDNWPEGALETLEAWPYDDPGFDPLPFDDSQLPRT